VTYLAQQRDKVKVQLDQADAALTAFQQQHGIADITAQIAGAVKENDTLRQNEADALASLADSRHTGAAIRGALGHTPSQVELYSDNTEAARALGEMRTQLLALQAKRADVASRFMATSPQVQQLDAQIAGLEQSLRQQQTALVDTKRMGRNTVYDATRDRLVQADANASGLAARKAAISGQLAPRNSVCAGSTPLPNSLTGCRWTATCWPRATSRCPCRWRRPRCSSIRIRRRATHRSA
jgi:uncharacterized protein involved in exopolysaccharide biosynthesis